MSPRRNGGGRRMRQASSIGPKSLLRPSSHRYSKNACPEAAVMAIFGSASPVEGHSIDVIRGNMIHRNYPGYNLAWYPSWLAAQVEQVFVNRKSSEGVVPHDQELLSQRASFYKIFIAISGIVRTGEKGMSINEVIELIDEEMSQLLGDICKQNRLTKEVLVFAILGWQSMLYQASFHTCPDEQLAIQRRANSAEASIVFDTNKVPLSLADRPLAILLKAFGNVLPAPSTASSYIASEAEKAGHLWRAIDFEHLNAYKLQSLLHVEICWVDALGLHLDFDKNTNTLSLFRFPSFCAAALQHRGAIHSFGSPDIDGIDPRASPEDINPFMREVLLSYRLLFGQAMKSRRYFRQLLRRDARLADDNLLFLLCTKDFVGHSGLPHDRANYFLERDFAMLGPRIELLNNEMARKKPKGWRDLLRDRRDTTQYWTFWLVAIFGVSSLVLSLLQCILTGLQLRR